MYPMIACELGMHLYLDYMTIASWTALAVSRTTKWSADTTTIEMVFRVPDGKRYSRRAWEVPEVGVAIYDRCRLEYVHLWKALYGPVVVEEVVVTATYRP